MLFNTHEFIFGFLPLTVILYWITLRIAGPRWSILVGAAASYIFYLFGERTYPWLLAVSIGMNYAFGRWIGSTDDGRRRRLIAAVAISLNLLALGYFKYFNFLSDQLIHIGLIRSAPWQVPLPIGISFFTFTQIAFLADVFQRKAIERQVGPYSLFVTFFPHLIAGPILHHKEMISQFRAPAPDLPVNIYSGVAMFSIGLSKKVLVADPCGKIASELFGLAAGGHVGFFNAWLGAIAYTVQIYFDFSGYSDMAIGIAQMLGIKLPVNFNSPYKATSIIDFWRRWHITLSRFLRDYLYIPLGGNRKGVARRYVNLLVTMLLGGVWHGAGWTFVLWGALHGAAQGVAHGWADLRKRSLPLPGVPAPVGWAATLVFVILAWVPFRAPRLHTAISMWRGMFGMNGFALPALGPLKGFSHRLGVGSEAVSFSTVGVLTIALALLLCLCAPNSHQIMRRFDMGLDSPGYHVFSERSRFALALDWRSALFVAVLIGLALRAIGSYSEFIYFQF
jgi:alginate O-acetyltransferase complex protein AlgI